MAGWVAFKWEEWEPFVEEIPSARSRSRVGDFVTGLPGMIVDMQTAEKISRIPETDIEFGTAVLVGETGDAYCRSASIGGNAPYNAAGLGFLGIAMRDMTSGGGVVTLGGDVYAVYDSLYHQGSWCVSIICTGLVWVIAKSAVREGDPVVVLEDGTFMTGANPAWRIPKARWATSAPAGMLAIVELNMPSTAH